MRISVLRAYSIVNLSDKFFEESMKDGIPYRMKENIEFINVLDDKKYSHNLDLDYDKILKEIKDG
jgi:hypothetical protein